MINAWNVDTEKLLSLHQQLDAVTYNLHAKVEVGDAVGKIKESDCSGYVRYVLYHSSGGLFPVHSFRGGSALQEEWCAKNLKTCAYDAANAGASDGQLRIGFRHKSKSNSVRHVWLLLNGNTYECSASGGGVNSVTWSNRIPIADACFVF